MDTGMIAGKLIGGPLKKLIILFAVILLIASFVFYRMGEQDALTGLRVEYPYLKNLQKGIGSNPGDVWITHNDAKDTVSLHIYNEGWERVSIHSIK